MTDDPYPGAHLQFMTAEELVHHDFNPPERLTEDYFNRRVKEHGGEVRKVQWVGRKHAPDRIALFPGALWWVELKRSGVLPNDGQLREHSRLIEAGQRVIWLDSKAAVDMWLAEIRRTGTAELENGK